MEERENEYRYFEKKINNQRSMWKKNLEGGTERNG